MRLNSVRGETNDHFDNIVMNFPSDLQTNQLDCRYLSFSTVCCAKGNLDFVGQWFDFIMPSGEKSHSQYSSHTHGQLQLLRINRVECLVWGAVWKIHRLVREVERGV
jgi:hypothetical protein